MKRREFIGLVAAIPFLRHLKPPKGAPLVKGRSYDLIDCRRFYPGMRIDTLPRRGQTCTVVNVGYKGKYGPGIVVEYEETA